MKTTTRFALAAALLAIACSKDDPKPVEPASATSSPAASPAPAATATASPAAPSTPSTSTLVAVGQPAPAFEAAAHDGTTVKLGALAGKPVVLYFYPKDDTPG
jgi:peroxiredoxin Q/BCP